MALLEVGDYWRLGLIGGFTVFIHHPNYTRRIPNVNPGLIFGQEAYIWVGLYSEGYLC